jgi:TolA-binding protein
MRLRPLLLFLALASLAFSGCAYFNTFYHAKQFYAQGKRARDREDPAQKPSAGSVDLFNKAIEKANKTLKDHPESRWTDDALFLIGNSYYEQQEYRKAEGKYQEIIERAPGSKMAHGSQLMLGKCYLGEENYVTAREALLKTLSLATKGPIAEEAQFTLGEVAFAQKDYGASAIAYGEFLKRFPKSRFGTRAKLRMVSALMEEKRYGDAAGLLEGLRLGAKRTERITLGLKLGDNYEALGRTPDAITLYRSLLGSANQSGDLAKIELRIALAEMTLKHYEQAEKRFGDIAQKYPRTEESATAYYQIGILQQEVHKNLGKARELYDKSRNEFSNAKVAGDALKRSTSIGLLTDYRKTLSSGKKEELAQSQFLLGELYLFDLINLDSARVAYKRVVTEFPRSDYAPKAEYALAWIAENVQKDSAQAQGLYRKLIQDYGDTDYADAGRRYLGLPVPERIKPLPDTTQTKSDSIKVSTAPQDTTLKSRSMIPEGPPQPSVPTRDTLMKPAPPPVPGKGEN